MSIHIPLELYQLRSNYRSFHTCILIMRKKTTEEKKKKKNRRKKATKDMQLIFKINLKTMLGHSLCMVLYCNVDTQLPEWIPFKNSQTGEWMKWGHRPDCIPSVRRDPQSRHSKLMGVSSLLLLPEHQGLGMVLHQPILPVFFIALIN